MIENHNRMTHEIVFTNDLSFVLLNENALFHYEFLFPCVEKLRLNNEATNSHRAILVSWCSNTSKTQLELRESAKSKAQQE